MASAPRLSAALLQGVTLKSVADEDRRDRSDAREAAARGGAGSTASAAEEAARRDYFFSTGVDEWYSEALEGSVTFRSEAVELRVAEARQIVRFWEDHVYRAEGTAGATAGTGADSTGPLIGGAETSPVEVLGIPEGLAPLVERVERCIREGFDETGAFVKLSTRSPKDAKLALRAAAAEYSRRLQAGESADGSSPAVGAFDAAAAASPPADAAEANRRIALLAEVQAATLCVHSGERAVMFMLDSERVAEDLKFALEAVDAAGGDESGWNVTVSVREWCPAVKLHSEWRGFVWGGTLNALGQYYHPLFFPSLPGIVDTVGSDCKAFFEASVKPIIDKAGLSNCMVDFAWLGPGEVLLVEVNPFDGVLGAFPVSTGLFLWEDEADQRTMREGPLEVRARLDVLPVAEQKDKMNPDWRRIVFGA
mmetsp:Transcript_94250/g.228855  ORF Transcript_94250/g.228855 Transcript_94250/m.228855 type:complete len:423 (-) Transcript_94250:422-1690(-)